MDMIFNSLDYKSPSAFETYEEYEEYCDQLEAAESSYEDEFVESYYEKLYND